MSISAIPASASIGAISELKGNSAVVRKSKTLTSQPQLPIEQMDNVQTGNGRVKIKFVDESTVSVTEHSKLVIDEFVYDGNPKTSHMALKFAAGTARFATGQKGIINKSNINLRTPTATIAVRGTDFSTTVDDFGKSLVILLPEADGSVGQIIVSNGGGTVVLTKAFQATTVLTYDSAPSKPVILNLSLDMVDNMLIVTPPDENKEQNEDYDSRANILDLSELDIDFLKKDDLAQDDLQITAIDISPLDANFLEDFLDDATVTGGTKDNVKVEGTSFGYNSQTQIYTIIEDSKLRFIRTVGSTIDVSIDKDSGKNLTFDNTGKQLVIMVNDGGSIINVKQAN